MRQACLDHDSAAPNTSSSSAALALFATALNDLRSVLLEKTKSISSYELSISGLVPTLLHSLCPGSSTTAVLERNHAFMTAFDLTGPGKAHYLLSNFLHKLISLFESVEKLPLYLYDAPGSYNLQAFSKRFKLTLRQGQHEANLLDFSGRVLKVEPLANVSHLEKYLAKMVLKQWFDYDRNCLNYITITQLPLCFTYVNDFDDNGLLYWIGTNGKRTTEWVNPAVSNELVKLSSGENKQFVAGSLEDIVGRQTVNCQTVDEKRVWVVVDLGVFIVPSCYSLRCSKGYSRMAPRNWAFLMSKTGGPETADWDLMYTHTNDESLKEPGATHTWSLGECGPVRKEAEGAGWRFARIQQTGRNQSGSSYSLALCGFEIYGKVSSKS